MKKRAIVYTVDDNIECLLQLVMSLKSVRRCSKEHMNVYILTDKPMTWMYDLYGATVINVSSMVSKYGLDKTGMTWRGEPVPPMLMFRLLIPLVGELQDYDQILYLDTDTEVWSNKFFNIFNIDENCEIIAVRDSLTKAGAARRVSGLRSRGGSDWVDPDWVYNRWDEIIKGRGKYANSGVLVFNMGNIKDKYEERIQYILNKMKSLKPNYPDQDTLNVYFKIYVVDDRRYNGWRDTVEGAYFRHYVGNDRKGLLEYPKPSKHRPNEFLDGVEQNEELGPLSGIVDNVYILVNGDQPANFEMLSEWLLSNNIKKYTKIDVSNTGLYSRLLAVAPCDKGVKPYHMDNWAGHYKAIVDAYEKGYEKIAIFEDSYIPRKLEDYISEIGSSFDLAICVGEDKFTKKTEFGASSSKGYIISKKCMVDLRRLFEAIWIPGLKGQKLRYVHKWLDGTILIKERTYTRKG